MKILLILLCSGIFLQNPICHGTIELSELLKNSSLTSKGDVCVVVSGDGFSITSEDMWHSSYDKELGYKNYSFGNRFQFDTPNKMIDYLKGAGFIVDFVQDSPDDNGNLYAYFKYEENYWKASFSCGSKGCGVNFYLLPR